MSVVAEACHATPCRAGWRMFRWGWRQDTTAAAAPRAKLSRHAGAALNPVVIDRLPIAGVAAGLGASRHTVNNAGLAAGPQLGIDDPAPLGRGRSSG
jgi:hypothetical protein